MKELLVIDRIRLKGVVDRKRQKIAKEMKAHPSTITRKVRGDIPLTIGDINTIAQVCEVDPSAFVMFVKENEMKEGMESEGAALAEAA